jgi:hypothetical protein
MDTLSLLTGGTIGFMAAGLLQQQQQQPNQEGDDEEGTDIVQVITKVVPQYINYPLYQLPPNNLKVAFESNLLATMNKICALHQVYRTYTSLLKTSCSGSISVSNLSIDTTLAEAVAIIKSLHQLAWIRCHIELMEHNYIESDLNNVLLVYLEEARHFVNDYTVESLTQTVMTPMQRARCISIISEYLSIKCDIGFFIAMANGSEIIPTDIIGSKYSGFGTRVNTLVIAKWDISHIPRDLKKELVWV